MDRTHALVRTDLPLPGRREGKVRDVYDLPAQTSGTPRLLLVATDRISAFDVVLPTPIPGKGRALTMISAAWFRWIAERGLAETHVINADVDALRSIDALTEDHLEAIRGRATIARRCEVIPVECVVRGYLDGTGWRDYEQAGAICGVELPPGLERGDRLPEPIFTPATKAPDGTHDQNITYEQGVEIAGAEAMGELRDTSLAIYRAAHEYAGERGLILADTKFEFGLPVNADGKRMMGLPVLIDEALTPDSSRYWAADRWRPGGPQESFDKQFVRDHLQALVDDGAWDKAPPGPELPDEVVRGTAARYAEAHRKLFG